MRGMKWIASAFAVCALAPSAFASPDPTGIWLNDTGRGAVEIKPCGNALCGNVVWVKDTSDSKGCGKQIIGNVAPAGNGRWDGGWIYSPERGRKYDVELTPLENGTLRVMGYAGMKFLSKTMIWKRAPQDLQLCGQTEAKTEQPAAAKPAEASTPAPADQAAAAAVKDEGKKEETQASAKEDTAKAETPKADTPAAGNNGGEAATADASKDDNAQTADADDSAKGDGPLGGLNLEKFGLGKIITKTKSGKCKLDTPWFRAQFDCEQ